jgi:hypothetical protein
VVVGVIPHECDALGCRDHAECRSAGIFDQRGDPHFQTDTDLKQQLSFSHRHQIARLGGVGVLVLIAAQQRGDPDMRAPHLLGKIL